MILATLFLSAVAQSSQQSELIDELARATDGYAVARASEQFADVRSVAAMQARVEIYDDKLSIKGGVHLRDWLYSGMIRASSAEETEVLTRAAANKKASPLLRSVALHALRRGEAQVPIEYLAKTKLEREDNQLGRAWQLCVGHLLASERLVASRKLELERARLRDMLLEAGMPFLGFRALEPNAAECEHILATARKSKNDANLAQLLYVLEPWAKPEHPAFLAFQELAAASLQSSSHARRVAASRTSLSAGAVELVPHFIAALDRAQDETPSWVPTEYAAVLRTLTQQQYASDPQPWHVWWQRDGQAWLASARAEGLIPAKRTDGEAGKADAHETVASFFGIQIVSQQVGFLIDGSGSMNNALNDDENCAQAAARQLASFLEQLPKDALLHLRVVTREIQSPFKKVVSANSKNRAKALKYVKNFDYGPASAMYDALLDAQSDQQLDTLIFVSDGGGSWGSFAYQAHMLDGLERAFQRSGVRIHCVCVGKNSRHARFMESLAALTGGTMIRP